MLEKIAVKLMSHLYRRVHLIKQPRTILGIVYKQLCRYLYAAITKFCDPIVLIKVGKQDLYMHASHDLPILKSKYRYYDTALPIICKFLQQKEGQINTAEVSQLQQLMNYGLAKPFFFFDALLFHKDRLNDLQEFYQQEMNVFPLQKVAS